MEWLSYRVHLQLTVWPSGHPRPPGQAFLSVAGHCEDQWLQRPEPGTADPLILLAKSDLRNALKQNQQLRNVIHVYTCIYNIHQYTSIYYTLLHLLQVLSIRWKLWSHKAFRACNSSANSHSEIHQGLQAITSHWWALLPHLPPSVGLQATTTVGFTWVQASVGPIQPTVASLSGHLCGSGDTERSWKITKVKGGTMWSRHARPLRLVHRARGICRDCKRCIKATAPALIARPHRSTSGNTVESPELWGFHSVGMAGSCPNLPNMDKPEPYQSQAALSDVVVVPHSICFHAFPWVESGARFQFPAFQWKRLQP